MARVHIYNFLRLRWRGGYRSVSDAPGRMVKHLEDQLHHFDAASGDELQLIVHVLPDLGQVLTLFYQVWLSALQRHALFQHTILATSSSDARISDEGIKRAFLLLYGRDMKGNIDRLYNRLCFEELAEHRSTARTLFFSPHDLVRVEDSESDVGESTPRVIEFLESFPPAQDGPGPEGDDASANMPSSLDAPEARRAAVVVAPPAARLPRVVSSQSTLLFGGQRGEKPPRRGPRSATELPAMMFRTIEMEPARERPLKESPTREALTPPQAPAAPASLDPVYPPSAAPRSTELKPAPPSPALEAASLSSAAEAAPLALESEAAPVDDCTAPPSDEDLPAEITSTAVDVRERAPFEEPATERSASAADKHPSAPDEDEDALLELDDPDPPHDLEAETVVTAHEPPRLEATTARESTKDDETEVLDIVALRREVLAEDDAEDTPPRPAPRDRLSTSAKIFSASGPPPRRPPRQAKRHEPSPLPVRTGSLMLATLPAITQDAEEDTDPELTERLDPAFLLAPGPPPLAEVRPMPTEEVPLLDLEPLPSEEAAAEAGPPAPHDALQTAPPAPAQAPPHHPTPPHSQEAAHALEPAHNQAAAHTLGVAHTQGVAHTLEPAHTLEVAHVQDVAHTQDVAHVQDVAHTQEVTALPVARDTLSDTGSLPADGAAHASGLDTLSPPPVLPSARPAAAATLHDPLDQVLAHPPWRSERDRRRAQSAPKRSWLPFVILILAVVAVVLLITRPWEVKPPGIAPPPVPSTSEKKVIGEHKPEPPTAEAPQEAPPQEAPPKGAVADVDPREEAGRDDGPHTAPQVALSTLAGNAAPQGPANQGTEAPEPQVAADEPCPDADGDGYKDCDEVEPDQRDCDDEDPDRHPGADEIPVDGVDQNCDEIEDCYTEIQNSGYGSPEITPSEDKSCKASGVSKKLIDEWSLSGQKIESTSEVDIAEVSAMRDYDGIRFNVRADVTKDCNRILANIYMQDRLMSSVELGAETVDQNRWQSCWVFLENSRGTRPPACRWTGGEAEQLPENDFKEHGAKVYYQCCAPSPITSAEVCLKTRLTNGDSYEVLKP